MPAASSGFGNYIKLLHDPVFWTSLGHTAIWIGLTVPLQMGLGLVAALLLNREFPWRGLARALVIIPWALAERRHRADVALDL